MRLDEVPPGRIIKIRRIVGGWGIHLRLARLGIYEEEKVKILESAPFGGPILLEHLTSGAKIAVGRGMARKIIVEELNEG